jgi:hypothetical protein
MPPLLAAPPPSDDEEEEARRDGYDQVLDRALSSAPPDRRQEATLDAFLRLQLGRLPSVEVVSTYCSERLCRLELTVPDPTVAKDVAEAVLPLRMRGELTGALDETRSPPVTVLYVANGGRLPRPTSP